MQQDYEQNRIPENNSPDVAFAVLRARIDHNLAPRLVCPSDDGLRERRGQETLRVVGDHDNVTTIDGGVEQVENGRFAGRS